VLAAGFAAPVPSVSGGLLTRKGGPDQRSRPCSGLRLGHSRLGPQGAADPEHASRVWKRLVQLATVLLPTTFQIFENVKQMISLNLPSILVPLVGLVFPAVAMASLFLYIEKEQLS
jgi:photosystem I subunit 8